jgi:NAD-dependent SIR2 family protein deacetylase
MKLLLLRRRVVVITQNIDELHRRAGLLLVKNLYPVQPELPRKMTTIVVQAPRTC